MNNSDGEQLHLGEYHSYLKCVIHYIYFTNDFSDLSHQFHPFFSELNNRGIDSINLSRGTTYLLH